MVKHIPKKVKTAVLVSKDSPNLLSSTAVIQYYPQLTNFLPNLSTEVVLCQLMYLTTNKLHMEGGKSYRFKLEQLRKAHFPWISKKQIGRILADLEEKKWIIIENNAAYASDYKAHPHGLKVYGEFFKKQNRPFIAVYPVLVAALTPYKPKGQKVAEYDPNGYGATALQQAIILARLQKLVGSKEDKTITRSHVDLHGDFFLFMCFNTYLKAMKALINRGLLLKSTVGELKIDTEYSPTCSVYQINYELLSKAYFPLVKPVAFDLGADKFYYADTFSKDISAENLHEVGYKNTTYGYLNPKH